MVCVCVCVCVCVGFAVLLFTSGALLFYTAMVAPVQIFLWDYGDQCNIFPSLYFDVIVDLFFMVRPSRKVCSNS